MKNYQIAWHIWEIPASQYVFNHEMVCESTTFSYRLADTCFTLPLIQRDFRFGDMNTYGDGR
jgi:hypothetical protein